MKDFLSTLFVAFIVHALGYLFLYLKIDDEYVVCVVFASLFWLLLFSAISFIAKRLDY